MRIITHIVVHCAATKAKADIGVQQIRKWHIDKGWSDIGYHFVIRRNGVLEYGRAVDKPGAHVSGHNSHSLGICLVGGIDDTGESEANFTEEQYDTLRNLINELKEDYPDAEVLGHRDFPNVKKDCPCFDVREWYKSGDVV